MVEKTNIMTPPTFPAMIVLRMCLNSPDSNIGLAQRDAGAISIIVSIEARSSFAFDVIAWFRHLRIAW
jgi:hypothetical protein